MGTAKNAAIVILFYYYGNFTEPQRRGSTSVNSANSNKQTQSKPAYQV
jgi:hypothetical protein